MELLERKRINYQELQEIKKQLKKLEELNNCLSDWTSNCYKLFEIKLDEKTRLMYLIRIKAHEDDEDYELQLIKEEQTR